MANLFPHRRLVTSHRDGTALHDQIEILAPPGGDGSGGTYLVASRGAAGTVAAADRAATPWFVIHLKFHGGGAAPTGLTTESVLAVLQDRLLGQQAALPCEENVAAMAGLTAAIAALRRRSVARAAQTVTVGAYELTPTEFVAGTLTINDSLSPEPPMPDATPAPSPDPGPTRLEITADQVRIGPATITRSELETTWKAWNWAETALKRLTPAVTAAELAALEAIPTTDAGRHGFAELRSALGR